MSDGKIFPRNLTARAAHRVAGNPASTRLESGVGNCYPGLEFDHRNLDRGVSHPSWHDVLMGRIAYREAQALLGKRPG